MTADVTTNLLVRVVPVNRPSQANKYGEQLGYYVAYVATDEYQLGVAEREHYRGIVHSGAGYGSHSTPRIAILNAMDDYADKFGPLCRADTTYADQIGC